MDQDLDAEPEHPCLQARTLHEVREWRLRHGVSIGGDAPKPATALDEAPFPDWALGALAENGVCTPSALQAQAWTIVARGQDVCIDARPGAGRRLSYLLPLLVRAAVRPSGRLSDGPCGHHLLLLLLLLLLLTNSSIIFIMIIVTSLIVIIDMIIVVIKGLVILAAEVAAAEVAAALLLLSLSLLLLFIIVIISRFLYLKAMFYIGCYFFCKTVYIIV